jgi:hypothetical protein
MKNECFLSLLLASMLATGCAFENTSKLFTPTAPSDNAGAAGTTSGGSSTTGGSGSTGGTSTTSPASAFGGTWGSPSIAGLPLGNCSDVKWLITTQTASTISGTVTANCASGVTVAGNLTGTLQSESVINLTATGTMTAMGLPCQFNLTGTGTRQSDDTMRVNYSGGYCLGTVSGTETLRKFPV